MTMPLFHHYGLRAIALGTVLSMSAGLAFAGDTVSADQILSALKPKPVTRGLSATPQGNLRAAVPQVDPVVQARESRFLASIRNRQTRSLSLGEREQIAEIAAAKPKIDLDI